ncbi:MAG TPA: ribosome maturation factor RimM [Gammaproteobacteria bacterium]|nr:ribosome maturation factor RimM [Gammaproteobacteria bacterium]
MPADGSSTAPPEAPVILGRVSSAFGVLGWVRVVSFTDPPDNLLQYSPWLLGDGTRWRPVQCATGRPHGSGFIVQLREIASRDEAQALSGSLIAVPRTALPAPDDDEYYWRDLEGLRVVDTVGRSRGRVSHLFSNGAHDILVIRSDAEGPDLLVPFLRQFVPQVDLGAGQLVIDWQEPA